MTTSNKWLNVLGSEFGVVSHPTPECAIAHEVLRSA